MSNFIDLTGEKFGRLFVKERAVNNKRGQSRWKCICDCGKKITANGGDLRSSHTRSCGCLRAEVTSQRRRIHGGRGTSTYKIWKAMKSRCYSKKTSHYHHYGGRGIYVCERWKNNYANFLSDMGERPEGLSIERIDNEKGYSPDNCKWATQKEQNLNKRTNRNITYHGETKCLSEWAKSLGTHSATLHSRLKKHSVVTAFTM